MAGKRLLITGGAGFLGYYLVQCRACTGTTRTPASRRSTSPCSTTTCAACPAWLEALRAPVRHLTLVAPRHDATAARGHGGLRLHHPRRGHRLADLLPGASDRDAWTPTSTACATCSTTPWQRQRRGRPARGLPVLLVAARSTAIRSPDAIPTPETYRGNVSCTGPRACYDESKRYRRDAVRELRAPARHAGQDGAPVQQLRAGAEDHRRARDARLRPRRARRPRHRDALGRHARRAPSVTSTDAITGYYKVLVRGRAGEAYNIGIERPEISMARAGGR